MQLLINLDWRCLILCFIASTSFSGIQDDVDNSLENARPFTLRKTGVSFDGGVMQMDTQDRIRILVLHTKDQELIEQKLKSSPDLISLNLEFAVLDDATLKWIHKCKMLEELYLGIPEKGGADGAYSNESLKIVSQMPNLQILHIRSKKINDKGLVYLQRLKKTKYLDLTGCRITDKSIATLSKMKNLCKLDLTKTLITQKGISELEIQLPDTTIHSGN